MHFSLPLLSALLAAVGTTAAIPFNFFGQGIGPGTNGWIAAYASDRCQGGWFMDDNCQAKDYCRPKIKGSGATVYKPGTTNIGVNWGWQSLQFDRLYLYSGVNCEGWLGTFSRPNTNFKQEGAGTCFSIPADRLKSVNCVSTKKPVVGASGPGIVRQTNNMPA